MRDAHVLQLVVPRRSLSRRLHQRLLDDPTGQGRGASPRDVARTVQAHRAGGGGHEPVAHEPVERASRRRRRGPRYLGDQGGRNRGRAHARHVASEGRLDRQRRLGLARHGQGAGRPGPLRPQEAPPALEARDAPRSAAMPRATQHSARMSSARAKAATPSAHDAAPTTRRPIARASTACIPQTIPGSRGVNPSPPRAQPPRPTRRRARGQDALHADARPPSPASDAGTARGRPRPKYR